MTSTSPHSTIPEYATKVLINVRPRPPHLEETVVGKDITVVIEPDTRPVLAFLNRNWSLLFAVAGLAVPRTGMKRPISVNKAGCTFQRYCN